MSDSRNVIRSATSSVVPGRRCGAMWARRVASAAPSGLPATRSVSTTPGATPLTRMPRSAPCTAALRIRPSTACLEAWYGTRSSLPRRLQIDPVITIAPPEPWAAYCRKALRSPRNVPRRLTAITRSKSSAESSSNGASEPGMPALSTCRSIRPKRSTIASAQSSTSASSEMSTVTGNAWSPNSSASSRARWPSRSAIATWAPPSASWRTVAEPMPPAPPVTSATLPSKS